MLAARLLNLGFLKLNKQEIEVLSEIAESKPKVPSPSKGSRYILLPANQMQASAGTSNPKVADFLVDLASTVSSKKSAVRLASRTVGVRRPDIKIDVLDSIHENGAKLVALDETQLADFRFSYPGLRIIPEKFYRIDFRFMPTRSGFATASRTARTARARSISTITVTDTNGNPLKAVTVVAFTDFKSRVGADGETDTNGKVKLQLNSSKVERMYVYPEHSFWGFYKKNFTLATNFNVKLKPIKLADNDGLRHFYPTREWPAITKKVRVGVIDTGFGPNKNVTIKAGVNMVSGENSAKYMDNDGHGTHVAGIIAAHGDLPGMAPGVELYIYRVFPDNGNASNFDIMKALDRAKADGCDLVNMSLGEAGLDEGIMSAIKDGYNSGMVCFAANGNEDRAPVCFPASYSLTIAVSAMGRKKTFPPQTVQTAIVKAPYGTDRDNFIADFSNIGPETDLTAPGVGIVSTYPKDLYAVMDGTSMACPAAVGMAARLLASQPAILGLPRNQERADEIVKFLSTKIKAMGFGANFEGKGMLFP